MRELRAATGHLGLPFPLRCSVRRRIHWMWWASCTSIPNEPMDRWRWWAWPHTPESCRRPAHLRNGAKAPEPTANGSLPPWRGQASTARLLSVWTQRCVKTPILPSGGTGFWRRSGHALRGTLLTRTDRGGETVSTWRIGSAYGAAFLSNQWYPDRFNTVRLGFLQGSVTLGFDLLGNVASEFWPDLKRKVLRRK